MQSRGQLASGATIPVVCSVAASRSDDVATICPVLARACVGCRSGAAAMPPLASTSRRRDAQPATGLPAISSPGAWFAGNPVTGSPLARARTFRRNVNVTNSIVRPDLWNIPWHWPVGSPSRWHSAAPVWSIPTRAAPPHHAVGRRRPRKLLRSDAIHWFQLRSVGGAVGDVPADATAYAWVRQWIQGS